ncbi:MAG TPA: ATP-binding protein, partial [Pseudomonadales bacterium]|nr:ATP-binding protein [Pseudomonadales bacterium]
HRLGPEQMKRRFEVLDLHALVQGVAASCYASIEVRNQRMELVADAEAREGRATVAGDPFLLETLTRNLLDNANKYTHDGGQIRLCLYCTEGNVVLRVEDDGPGIALTAREHVFDRFRRAGGDMHASGVSGSGLGLAIVRNIAELHGACIEVGDSTFASGACFTVAFHRDAGARN